VKYGWIKEHHHEFNVVLMCRMLGVCRSSYYDWLNTPISSSKLETQHIMELIAMIFTKSRNTYGTRRIQRALAKEGIQISRRRIKKLMNEQGFVVKTKKKFKATTDSNHSLPVADNLLDRDFNPMRPNQTYAGDITYVPTEEGWLYLAVVIDLFSRQIVGWSMDRTMRAELVNNALLMAIWKRKPARGLLWHTDRGSQYASDSHRAILKAHGIIQSMSRKGNCWDNAVSESFFHTLKTELIHHHKFKTREEAKQAIFEYIEIFYNRVRMHSANDYLSPVEYEQAQNYL
jgi:putative transposase